MHILPQSRKGSNRSLSSVHSYHITQQSPYNQNGRRQSVQLYIVLFCTLVLANITGFVYGTSGIQAVTVRMLFITFIIYYSLLPVTKLSKPLYACPVLTIKQPMIIIHHFPPPLQRSSYGTLSQTTDQQQLASLWRCVVQYSCAGHTNNSYFHIIQCYPGCSSEPFSRQNNNITECQRNSPEKMI